LLAKAFMTKSDYKLLPVILAGLCIWLISAFFSDGYYQADEHFQILEFANYKLGNISSQMLPWEFSEQMRPGFQPLLAFLIIKSCSFIGITSPFTQVLCMRMITALLAFGVTAYFLRRIKAEYGSALRQFFLWSLLFFLWFMPLLVVRFSSENLSGICMLLSLALIMLPQEKVSARGFLLAGIIAGLAFLFRYQSAIMIAGLFFWMLIIQKPGWKKSVFFLAGLIVVCGCGFFADRWLYGEWVCAPWNYFSNNLLMDKLSSFGTKPWHHYFTSGTEQLLFPVGLVVWISAAVFWITKSRSALTWISIPFVLFHVLLSHKEVRFLFPLFYLIPVFILQAAVVLSKVGVFRKKWMQISLIAAFLFLNLAVLSVFLTKTMERNIGVLHQVHQSGTGQKLLYYNEGNPSNPFGIPYYFYLTHDITSVKVNDSLQQIPLPSSSDTTVFLYEEMRGINYRTDANSTLMMCKFPAFLRPLNLGHWQERTANWALYRIK